MLYPCNIDQLVGPHGRTKILVSLPGWETLELADLVSVLRDEGRMQVTISIPHPIRGYETKQHILFLPIGSEVKLKFE